MYIGYSVLLLICFGCLSFGACIGMVVISLCRISAECSREEEEQEARLKHDQAS